MKNNININITENTINIEYNIDHKIYKESYCRDFYDNNKMFNIYDLDVRNKNKTIDKLINLISKSDLLVNLSNILYEKHLY